MLLVIYTRTRLTAVSSFACIDLQYWNMPYRDPKTDYYYAGEWFGHTEFFRAPAVFTSWGNPSLFNQGALCDEIEPPAPFTCRRTVGWLHDMGT